jgi:hypothetical protein
VSARKGGRRYGAVVATLHTGMPYDNPDHCARCGWRFDVYSVWREIATPGGGRRRVHRMCARLPLPGFPGYSASLGGLP